MAARRQQPLRLKALLLHTMSLYDGTCNEDLFVRLLGRLPHLVDLIWSDETSDVVEVIKNSGSRNSRLLPYSPCNSP